MDRSGAGDVPTTGAVTIDCDDCAVRGPGCKDCVVSVLLGVPETLCWTTSARRWRCSPRPGWHRDCGLVPIHRHGDSGVVA